MFWIFLIVIMGAFLINLGAMTVLLKLIFTAFKAAMVVIMLLSGMFVWRWYRNRRHQ